MSMPLFTRPLNALPLPGGRAMADLANHVHAVLSTQGMTLRARLDTVYMSMLVHSMHDRVSAEFMAYTCSTRGPSAAEAIGSARACIEAHGCVRLREAVRALAEERASNGSTKWPIHVGDVKMCDEIRVCIINLLIPDFIRRIIVARLDVLTHTIADALSPTTVGISASLVAGYAGAVCPPCAGEHPVVTAARSMQCDPTRTALFGLHPVLSARFGCSFISLVHGAAIYAPASYSIGVGYLPYKAPQTVYRGALVVPAGTVLLTRPLKATDGQLIDKALVIRTDAPIAYSDLRRHFSVEGRCGFLPVVDAMLAQALGIAPPVSTRVYALYKNPCLEAVDHEVERDMCLLIDDVARAVGAAVRRAHPCEVDDSFGDSPAFDAITVLMGFRNADKNLATTHGHGIVVHGGVVFHSFAVSRSHPGLHTLRAIVFLDVSLVSPP